MQNLFIKATAAASLLVMLCSCDNIFPAGMSSSGIGVRVSAHNTKASAETYTTLTAGGQFDIIAIADGAWTDNATGTTGTAGVYFTDVVTYDGSSTSWLLPDTHKWLNGVNLHFWSYFPADDAFDSASEGIRSITTPAAGSSKMVFTYALPESASNNDATLQKDMIFAGNSEKRTFDSDGEIVSGNEYININFYHPLSEIRFAVSSDDGTFDTNLKIKTIRISNVASSGKCEFTLPSTFAWSDFGSTDSYAEDVNATFTSSTVSGWNKGSYEKASTTYNLYTYGKSFFMIPQDASTASIDITFENGGETTTKTVALSDTWKAGEYYTYKINASISTDIALALELIDWNLIEEDIELETTIGVTDGTLVLSPLVRPTDPDCRDAIADGGTVTGKFTVDTPIGATWFVSVSNTDAFTVEGENGSSDPAYGTVDGGPQVFYVRVKPGDEIRAKMQRTRVSIALKLADGTMVNIDEQLVNIDKPTATPPTNAWNIILNPIK